MQVSVTILFKIIFIIPKNFILSGLGNRESSKLSKVDDSELFQHSKKEIGDTATTTEGQYLE